MKSWSTGAGNEVETTGRKEGEGSLGKRTGNKSRETCGGPVPIEKQNGDISHGVNREGRPGSRLPGKSSPLETRNRTLRSTQGGKLPQAEPPAAPTYGPSNYFFP